MSECCTEDAKIDEVDVNAIEALKRKILSKKRRGFGQTARKPILLVTTNDKGSKADSR